MGIGTNSPGYPLDIKQQGNCNFRVQSLTSGSSNLILARSTAATANCFVNYKTGTTALWYTGVAGSNTDFRIRNGAGSDYVFIGQATGNVGIGTTTPLYKLDVKANAGILDSLKIEGFAPKIDFTFGGATEASMEDVAGTKFLISTKFAMPIQFTANGTTGLYVKNDSRMGMGTTNPQSNLHVYGIYPDLRIQGQNGLGTFNPVRMSFWSDPQGSAQEWRPGYIQSDDSAAGTWTGIMRFFTNGTSYANRQNSVEGMRIINGRVGIYDTMPDPYYRLTVGGNVRCGGEIVINGRSISTVGFEIQHGGDVTPTVDNFYYSGSSAKRWNSVYATNGTIQTSDARMKKEIKALPYGLNEVMKLQPIIYKWKDENLGNDNNLGFVAQDLQKVVKEVVVDHTTRYNPETKKVETTPNDVLGVKYSELIPVLVKAIQEQQEQITTLQTENAAMQECFNNVCNTAATSKTTDKNLDVAGALFQNTPNPFNQTTVIRYALKSENTSGKIIIRDLSGNLVKQVNIANSGKGQVTINANELATGTYTYTLEIAGASVDTKLMVVTK